MKKLKPTSDKTFSLTAGQLDLRSPAGRTQEGAFRLVVNAIGDTRGKLRRLGGWRRLTLSAADSFVDADTVCVVSNEDLHDQLLTPYDFGRASVAMGRLYIIPPIVNVGYPAVVQVGMPTMALSVPELTAAATTVVAAPDVVVAIVPPGVTASAA